MGRIRGVLAVVGVTAVTAAAVVLGTAGAASAASALHPASVVVQGGSQATTSAPATGRFFPVATTRVFDGQVTTNPVTATIGGVAGGVVPANATAVVVNVEVSSPTSAGYVRITPDGGIDAQVATQEFARGQTISNLATVALSSGRVQVKLSSGAARVFLDVSGYYADSASGATYTPVASARILNSVVTTSPTILVAAGKAGIASNATAVVVNTEVEAPTAAGYVRVTPQGKDAQVAVQEFSRGQTISNLVTTGLTAGALQVKVSAGSARVFMDVVGYYSPSSSGSVFVPLANTARVSAASVTTSASTVTLVDSTDVPTSSGVTAVVANAEVEAPTSAGYLRITPGGTDAQVATQEFGAGQTISNLTIGAVDGRSVATKVSAGRATLYLDVSGYFTSGASAPAVGNDVSWPQCASGNPETSAFGIVGVNNGLGNQTNTCLQSQLGWAEGSFGGPQQPLVQLYVNISNPGVKGASVWPSSNVYPSGTSVSNPYGTCAHTDSTACAYMYGYARAWDDVKSRGVASPTSYRWWLDVESYDTTWQTGTTGRLLNRADLEGAVAGFRAAGVTRVGVYGPASDWNNDIIGTTPSSSSLHGLPTWLPVGTDGLGSAQDACTDQSQTGGPVVMTQYIASQNGDDFDFDWSCE